MRILLLLFFTVPIWCLSQNVTRWSKKEGFKSLHLKAVKNEDIFKDYSWTYPDVHTNLVENSEWKFNGQTYRCQMVNETTVLIYKGDELLYRLARQQSKGKQYFDKSKLSRMYVEVKRWRRSVKTEQKIVTVIRYVPESYTAYEGGKSVTRTRSVPRTTTEMQTVYTPFWEWTISRELQCKIPVYNYFSCVLDGHQIYIYQLQDTVSGVFNYYFQNASYISAEDASGTDYLLVDRNADGAYTGNEDIFLVNTWNPYLEKSKFIEADGFLENFWYDIKFLKEEYFVDFQYVKDSLNVHAENDIESNRKPGKIVITNIPDNTTKLYINDRSYRCLLGTNSYKSETGKYKLRLIRKGYLDFDTVFTIFQKAPTMHISYKETGKAGIFKAVNLSSENYFITAYHQANGYKKIVHNQDFLNLPEGDYLISIHSSNYSIEREIVIVESQETTIDVEDQIKHLNQEDFKAPLLKVPITR